MKRTPCSFPIDMMMNNETQSFGGIKTYWAIGIVAVWALGTVGMRVYRNHADGSDVSREQLRAWMDQGLDVCILDVRSPREYASGYIPNAINISHKDLPARLAELEPYKNHKIVVYCESGVRSRIAQNILKKAGFGEVDHLTGDMSGWRKARWPVDAVQNSTESKDLGEG